MEETKLDRAVAKLFDLTERISSAVLSKRLGIRFVIIMFCFGVVNTVIQFWFWADKTLTIESFYRSLSGPLLIAQSIILFYSILKSTPDLELKTLKFIQKFYSEETVKLCFVPLFADWKTEYSQSIKQGENWRARCISFRYFFAFISSIIQQSSIGRFIEILWRSLK
mgnify:CR=1 FL=1